ncbi:MAG: transporter [Methylococcaceae bacterium]
MIHSALRIFFLVRFSLISGTLALLLLGQFLSESVLGSDAQPDEIQPTADTLDITNPGSDLANFPNSAFTLPAGGFYLEMTPVNLTSSSKRSSPQYNAEYLLRYGLLDDVEIRLYSQGFTVQGNPNQAVGFSPLTFDSKIHFWDEWKEYYLPAAGLEVLLQTDLLGSSAFNAGLQPAFSINFDQTLPYDFEIEYNLGATRFPDPQNLDTNVWDATFAWAIQRSLTEDIDLFINGYYNSSSLPRMTTRTDKYQPVCPTDGPCQDFEKVRRAMDSGANVKMQAVGVGGIWTMDEHTVFFTNLAAGASSSTPNFTGYLGFAWTP